MKSNNKGESRIGRERRGTWKGINKLSIDEELGEVDGGYVEGGSVVAVGERSHSCVSGN